VYRKYDVDARNFHLPPSGQSYPRLSFVKLLVSLASTAKIDASKPLSGMG
jgi:hypothetical protein